MLVDVVDGQVAIAFLCQCCSTNDATITCQCVVLAVVEDNDTRINLFCQVDIGSACQIVEGYIIARDENVSGGANGKVFALCEIPYSVSTTIPYDFSSVAQFDNGEHYLAFLVCQCKLLTFDAFYLNIADIAFQFADRSQCIGARN